MNLPLNHPVIANFLEPGPQWLVIAVLVLILFGSKKLPTFARSLGRSLGEFKKAKDEFEQELHGATLPSTPQAQEEQRH